MHLYFNFLCRRASNRKYCYETQEDVWKSLGYILRIIHCHGDATLYKNLHYKKCMNAEQSCAGEKQNTTGKHFELFQELRKLSPNPIFSNSVTTTTKPSYMTNSVVLKSRKWQ